MRLKEALASRIRFARPWQHCRLPAEGPVCLCAEKGQVDDISEVECVTQLSLLQVIIAHGTIVKDCCLAN